MAAGIRHHAQQDGQTLTLEKLDFEEIARASGQLPERVRIIAGFMAKFNLLPLEERSIKKSQYL